MDPQCSASPGGSAPLTSLLGAVKVPKSSWAGVTVGTREATRRWGGSSSSSSSSFLLLFAPPISSPTTEPPHPTPTLPSMGSGGGEGLH